MKDLFQYLKKYRLEAILGPLFKLLEASFELIVPLIVALIIDEGIKNNDKSFIILMVLVICLLGLVGFICSVTAQYFSAKAAVGFSSVLRSKVFEKIQSLSFTEYDELGTGTMITRITNDINQIQTGVNLTLRLFLRSPFIVFGAMIMAFTVDVKSALIFTVAIPILSIIVFLIILYTMPLYKKVQNKLDKVVVKTRENLTGVRVIRAFSKEEDETKEYIELNNDLKKKQNFVSSISNLMNPLTYIIVNIAIVFILWTTGFEVNSGALKQGEVIAIYNYMSQILVELIKIANLIISISKAIACGNRVSDILKMNSSLKHTENNEGYSKKYIEFRNVYFRYKDAQDYSLNNISFNVRKGDTVGIIGATGSGKTSLVNLLPHFYDISEGVLKIDGQDVSSIADDELREKIAIVMQKSVLFKGTVRSNLQYGKNSATEEEMIVALKLADAFDFVNQKEGGLDAIVEQNGKNFSGGQKQRLSIARALIKKSEILIMDDSQSALDYATDAKIRKNIKALDYKPTIFIVSQRTSAIKDADIIIVLEDGKMIGCGKHDELLLTCPVYSEIHYSQYKKGVK